MACSTHAIIPNKQPGTLYFWDFLVQKDENTQFLCSDTNRAFSSKQSDFEIHWKRICWKCKRI